MAHAITLWGIEISDEPAGTYTGVWVTDSDDDKDGYHPRPDDLAYYEVELSDSNWYLQDFYGSDYHFIAEMQALTMAEPVPEPATMLLLGAGILGLGIFRRRWFKKS